MNCCFFCKQIINNDELFQILIDDFTQCIDEKYQIWTFYKWGIKSHMVCFNFDTVDLLKIQGINSVKDQVGIYTELKK